MKSKGIIQKLVKMTIAYLIAYFAFVGKHYMYEEKFRINLFSIEPEKYFVILLTLFFALLVANEIKKHLTK
jgi:hypothetical protein